MKPQTDYIRHAARLARKLQLDAAMGGTPQPDAEFYKALSKALDKVGPRYAEEEEEETPPARRTPVKPQLSLVQRRKQDAVRRNVAVERKTPGSIAQAGAAHRERLDLNKLDVASMSDEEYAALPESAKAKLRGDG